MSSCIPCYLILVLLLLGLKSVNSSEESLDAWRLQRSLENLRKPIERSMNRLSVKLAKVWKKLSSDLSMIFWPFSRNTTNLYKMPICPPSWTSYKQLCLMFIDDKITWLEAEDFCKSKGGHLVWFESKLEHQRVNRFLTEQYPSLYYPYHIGLTRSTPESPLTWSSGSASSYRGYNFKCGLIRRWYFAQNSLDTFKLIGTSGSSYMCPFVCRKF